jgi:ATP-dependent DNA helicase RecQ
VRRFFTAAAIRRAARDHFGWRQLRPGQLAAVRTLLGRRDVLVVMPTGAGKSAVYQLAGMLLAGPTVVVSPLIALQRDQLAGLAARNGRNGRGPEGVAVNSAQSATATSQAWESLRAGDAEFVFLAPEQLANDEVVAKLADAGVSLLVVDEAHCVSTWGHDFRPDYLRIGDVLGRLGSPTVVALTATAAPPVRAEIVEKLRMRAPKQFIHGFDRPNLRLEVARFTEARHKRAAVVERVGELNGSGLVYTATRKESERYAEELAAATGRSVRAYHAGLRSAERHKVHEGFLSGRIEVVVATSAFGMGIDKPDVRFVVHADISESLDAYYQEIGRAGRDGEPALALLLYRSEDLGLRSFFASGEADEDTLRSVAAAVRRHTHLAGAVEPSALRAELHLSHTRLTGAVNLLEQAGAVGVGGDGRLRYAKKNLSVRDAVGGATEAAQARAKMEKSRIEMMRGYAETTDCRRRFLLGYFGEAMPRPCGNCDACAAGSPSRSATSRTRGRPLRRAASSPYPQGATVTHREWGDGVVMRLEPDRITVLFDSVGYRTLALRALREDDGLLSVRAKR